MTTTSHNHHPHHAALMNPDGSWKYTNALIDATSPYLRQHAHNPVDWFAWGDEAFDEAKRRGVPIFLSIGYSTCYWCHVMERQVFEDPAIAAQMNEKFVNIKVDREERPDLDDIYMAATQIMTRRGGWPMSVFLTPPGGAGDDDAGLRPFWCATYIPPTPMHGMASFPQVLDALSRAYANDRGEILEQADKVTHYVSEQLASDDEPIAPDPRLIYATANALANTYDPDHGGFGDAPKFPQACSLAFLLAVEQSQANHSLWMMLEHTLDRMARGGMYDQIGGGFHRYSVDEKWLVPHFEKMLYDNGQLAELYANAALAHPDSEHAATFRRVAIETCDYVLREMRDPIGAFWSAQDAEVNAMEGGNYVWTPPEVAAAVDDDALTAIALKMYGLDQGPNFKDPHIDHAPPVNVLCLPKPLAGLAQDLEITEHQLAADRQEINRRLLAARDQRDQPGTDDKVLTSWNGMMIAGFAAVGAAFDRPDFIDAGTTAADAIDQHLNHDGDDAEALARAYRAGQTSGPAYLEDYAQLIHAMLVLHRATREARHLDRAVELTAHVTAIFAHPHGGYYDTDRPRPDLIVRTRTHYDGATPSGNSQMAHNLIDLYRATDERTYLERAADDMAAFSQKIAQQSPGMTHLLHAMLRLQQIDATLFTPAAGASALAGSTPQPTAALRIEPPTTPITFKGGRATFTLTLHLADGYHLSANSEADLQPATLTTETDPPTTAQTRWPDPVERTYPFADQPLEVYEGTIEVRVTLQLRDADAASQVPDRVSLTLTYQACTEQACDQPTTMRLALPVTRSEHDA